jgi:hypothetical protein
MRVVAKVQLESPFPDARENAARCIRDWAENKFTLLPDGSTRIRLSGEEALYEHATTEVGQQSGNTFALIQPIDLGDLKTDVSVVQNEGRCSFQTVLSVASTAGIVAPRVTIRAPRFVDQIVAQGGWYVARSKEHVRAMPLFLRERELAIVDRLLTGEGRRLPIILVSELEGRVLGDDIDSRLARDICGMAHVVRLSSEASWSITNRLGKAWSAFNGAVRLLWPMAGKLDNPRAHPLWTYDTAMFGMADEAAARDRLRRELARRVLDASTFVPDDPVHADFAKAATRQRADAERERQATSGDKSTIESLTSELQELRAQIDERDRRITILEDNTAALLRALNRPGNEVEIEAGGDDLNEVPQTVAEAINLARAKFARHLLIAADVEDDATNLNAQAGPPEKLLRYLATLAELSQALAAGPLGKSVPGWLADHNVECSGDSETVRKRTGARSFRLSDQEGRVDCEWHAKPSDGVSPDRCVRIYFGLAPTEPKVRIGYIGRHVD